MEHQQIKPMFDVKQTIEDLANSINYLREHGWTQGKNFNLRGDCCAWGAVIASVEGVGAGLNRMAEAQVERTSNVARAFYRFHQVDIVAYNDAEGRTKDQVIRALEATLDALSENPTVLTAKIKEISV